MGGANLSLFDDLEKITYEEYLSKHPFHLKLGISLKTYTRDFGNASSNFTLKSKIKRDRWNAVDKKNYNPYPAELDDLIRLHWLVTSKKILTILEFGIGKSTVVFDDALQVNKIKYEDFVKKNLRKKNIFECHSIDNSKNWIRRHNSKYNSENVISYYSKCRMGLYNDQICTYYDKIPNISPDLIYLDAPDQYSVVGQVNGRSTRFADAMPMAADILRIEHFLQPGTIIAVDGRTANARFLKTNLKREWGYNYYDSFDQHFFELIEEPLGYINKEILKFKRT
jgi:hypothetical protein